MAADSGYTKPTNQILVAGQPLVQTLKIKTAGNCYPGRLVMRDTTDGEIKVSDGTELIGWLGYEQTIKKHRPATVDTIYLTTAHVVVLNGGHFVIVASLASGQNVVKGAMLEGTAAGEVTALSSGTMVGIAEESVDQSGGGSGDIMVRSVI